MLNWVIVGLAAAVIAAGHLLLIRSAWQLRKVVAAENTPTTTPRADLIWTIITAGATVAVLGWTIVALLGPM